MTPRIENEARIDVLVVMDRAADKIESYTEPCFEECELRAAQSAVADLIEAARKVADANASGPANSIVRALDGENIDWSEEINALLTACDKLVAALVRIGGAA